MRRSGSRTRVTNSGDELCTRRSHLATTPSSPRPSASSGLVSGSRTLIQFSNSVSTYSGPGENVTANTHVSIRSGHNPRSSGSASSAHRSASGHGGAPSTADPAHLGMLSSRSDSVIHGMAHMSESRINEHRQSGHSLDAHTSIQITPVSSTMESMLESRVSRDRRALGWARSGEDSDLCLERQLDDSSLRSVRRRSGSQARLNKSRSRSPSDREDSTPQHKLVDVDANGRPSRERRINSSVRSVILHGPSERKGESHQSSSLIAAHSPFQRSMLSRVHSSGQSPDARSAASAERTSSSFENTNIKAAMTSAFKAEFESWKRSRSLLDKSRTSPIGLGATPAADSVVQRREHETVATSHEDLSGLSSLPSSDSSSMTTTENTKVRSQLLSNNTTAIQEISPPGAAVLEVGTIEQPAREQQKGQHTLRIEYTNRASACPQKTESASPKFEDAGKKTTSSELTPEPSVTTTVESAISTFPSKSYFDNRKFSSGSCEQNSLMYPRLLQKETSKSLLQPLAHQSSLFSDKAPNTLTNTSAVPVRIPAFLEKEDFLHPVNQQPLFRTTFSSENNFDMSALSHALNEDPSQPRLLDQPSLTLLGSSEGSMLCTNSAPRKTSSRTFTVESPRQASSDELCGAKSAPTNKSELHHDVFDKSAAPARHDLRDSSSHLSAMLEKKIHSKTNVTELTHILASAPERTSSKSNIHESANQTILLAKPPEAMISADAKHDTFKSSPALVDHNPVETDSKSYSLSAGTHLTMTKKVNTRWKTNEPVHQLLLERVEGSNYQKFIDNTQHSPLTSRGVKSDYQKFQVTISESTPAAAEFASVTELPPLTHEVFSTERSSTHKENEVEEKPESQAAGALTPLPELPLIRSTSKSSSEGIRSSENDQYPVKATNQYGVFNWPSFDLMGNHSTRLGEAAVLFEEPSEVIQTSHRGTQLGFSDNRDTTDSASHAEDQDSGHEEASGRRIYELSMQEGTAPARASESLTESRICPIKYVAEQEQEVPMAKKGPPHSSLKNDPSDEYILEQIVREVEKKIKASSLYDYAPLPDDVLAVRSSKGIESLGQLKYETYDEELLMRHSDDELTQEQKRSTTKVSATAIKQHPARIDQGGHAGVLEVYYASIEKETLQPKVTELPAIKQTLLPEYTDLHTAKVTRESKVTELPALKQTPESEITELLPEEQILETNVMELSAEKPTQQREVTELSVEKQTLQRMKTRMYAEKLTREPMVTELPAEIVKVRTEAAEKQTWELKVSELPAYKETSVINVTELAADKRTPQLKVTELAAGKQSPEPRVSELHSEEHIPKLNVTELPAEKQTQQLNVIELSVEKQALQPKVTRMYAEKRTPEPKVTNLAAEKPSPQLKVRMQAAEKQTSELKVSELPAYKETPVLNVTELAADKQTRQHQVTELAAGKQTPEPKVSKLPPEEQMKELNVTELPAEKRTSVPMVANVLHEQQLPELKVTELPAEKHARELMVSELPHEKQTALPKVNELPAEKQIPLLKVTKVSPEKRPEELKVTEVPAKKETPGPKVTELPSEKQIPLLKVTKIAPEKHPLDLKVTELPAEKRTRELTLSELHLKTQRGLFIVNQLPAEKEIPLPKVNKVALEKETLELEVTELPAEKRTWQLKMTELPDEKQTAIPTVTGLLAEKRIPLLNVTEVASEKKPVDLNVTELPAEKGTRKLKATELPAEKEKPEPKVTYLPAQKKTTAHNVTWMSGEKLAPELKVTELPNEKQTALPKLTELPAEKDKLLATVAELSAGKHIPRPKLAGPLVEKPASQSKVTTVRADKETLQPKVTEWPAEKLTSQPKMIYLPAKSSISQPKVTELPAEKTASRPNVPELPEKKETQQPEINDMSVPVLDQEGYAGVLEEYYESARKRNPEQKPEEARATPSVDVDKEATPVVRDKPHAITTETQGKRQVIDEHEQRKCEYAEKKEAEDNELHPKKSFDVIREERRRQFEQRWREALAAKGTKWSPTSLKNREALQMPEKATLPVSQVGSAETRDKAFPRKQSSENTVRRLIEAAIEEAAKREEAAKSDKRFRGLPCSASTEDAPRKLRSSSSDTSANERTPHREKERCLADVKVHQEKEKATPELLRCKSFTKLIEGMIQQHVRGCDIHRHRLGHEKVKRAQDCASAQAPGFLPSTGQHKIPAYYQTATTARRLGDPYVEHYHPSLLDAPRKSDTRVVSSSHTERQFSFSTSSSRGARCVFRKLEPGALTYLVEVSTPDKNRVNQTDMVMAEEQMLVNEIFDHMTSGTRLNELAPIIVSPAASLTAIRNAYAEAVARRVLGNQLHRSNESILSASQKAEFYESGPGVNLQKTPSSTSVHSMPSVESYIVQTMLDGGVIKNFKELWGKVPYTLNNAIVSRTRSLDALATTKTSARTTAAPLPKSRNAGHGAPIEMGAGNKENFAGPREETPPYVESIGISERNAEDLMAEALTEDIPSCATLEVVVDETDAAPNFVETKQSTGAATLVKFHKQTCSPSFPSNEGTARESERTTTADEAVATTPKQRPWVKQNSSESLNNAIDVDSSDCVCCKKYTSPDKSFESFICFGLHETPKYFAPVPVDVSGIIKLRIATDADVREIMPLPWKEPEFKYILPAAIATRHVLCPSTFFVAVDTLRGHICGAASVLVFDEEVAFCGFCHVRETYAFEHIGVLLWNQMLHVTSGKNLFTVLPEPAFRELHEIYPFSSDPSTDIMLGQARLSRAAFKRTILVVEYKDKYFDALAAYDKRVFGFSRKRYLTSTVHEVGLNVRLATRNERNVCGYGSVQRGDDGRVVLRWLFADDVETAESLLYSLLASCSHDDEVDVVAGFYLRSTSTRPILDKVSSHELKPWRLVYTKREPLHSYGRVVCLTTV